MGGSTPDGKAATSKTSNFRQNPKSTKNTSYLVGINHLNTRLQGKRYSIETDLYLQVESPLLVAVSLENETPEPLVLPEPRHAFSVSGRRLASEV